jgi:uncharacterized protein YndB with AHSA1/START domain
MCYVTAIHYLKGSACQAMVADAIEREILIEAPRDVVWRVITEPEQIAHWFVDAAELDLRPGGSGTFTFESRATHQRASVALTVESVEAPHRLAYRWAYPSESQPSEDNSLLVEFTLTPEGDHTRLRLVERGFLARQWSEDERTSTFNDHSEGWDLHLGRLRAYASESAITPRG